MTSYELTVQILSIYFHGEELIDAVCATFDIHEWEAKRLIQQVNFKKEISK